MEVRAERASKPFDIGDQMAGTAGMLGAAANVVMQLGHPGVGYGVLESRVDSGNVLLHPWKRLRTTLSYLVVALFGSPADVDAYRKAVNRAHAQVRSRPDSPVEYNAFDPALQLWVAACLYVGFRDARTLFLGPMDEATADGLYDYCHRLGTSLQVPRDAWPADRAAFEEYWRAGLAEVSYDEPVRAHLLKVVDLEMVPRWMRFGNAPVNRFFTVGMLPPEVRTAMRLPWTARDQRRFERAVRALRTITRLTPRWARVLPIHLQLAEVRLRIRRGWQLV
ncbi:oxygenase MpaB family protein [Marmoricola sp. RAF53]|uniref:oxygenase MpaB family protein n=1 Tax=Marmoricola sp. RAF53 TaxID=3233059 RepID=UPI003F99B335